MPRKDVDRGCVGGDYFLVGARLIDDRYGSSGNVDPFLEESLEQCRLSNTEASMGVNAPQHLRLLAMDALERIEVALRVDASHTLGKLDPVAYLTPELFDEKFSRRLDKGSGLSGHHEWLTKHAQLIGRSKEEFVRHNRTRYGLPLAIWVACEVWDFGTLSTTLFSGMRVEEQDAIAGQYGVRNGRIFAGWLRSLNYLRNVCAHHSRLWNRNIIDQPKLPPPVMWIG